MEEKAILIRRIFQQFLSGVSFKLIMQEAAANGLHHTGKSACVKILRNSVYASLLKVPGDHDMPEKIVKAIHTPIIAEDVYWSAQHLLQDRPKHGVHANKAFRLKGILLCGCGKKLTASFNKGKKRLYMYYSCPKERNLNYLGERSARTNVRSTTGP